MRDSPDNFRRILLYTGCIVRIYKKGLHEEDPFLFIGKPILN